MNLFNDIKKLFKPQTSSVPLAGLVPDNYIQSIFPAFSGLRSSCKHLLGVRWSE